MGSHPDPFLHKPSRPNKRTSAQIEAATQTVEVAASLRPAPMVKQQNLIWVKEVFDEAVKLMNDAKSQC